MRLWRWALLVVCRADLDGVSLLSRRCHEALHFSLVQTSGEVNLTQMAPMMSLDTACKHHPGAVFDLYLYEKGGASVQPAVVAAMKKAGCTLRPRVVDEEIFEDTPLESFVRQKWKTILAGEHHVVQLSDLVRLMVLWRHGGWYLDTDVLVLKPLNELHDVVGKCDQELVNNAVLHFTRASPFLSHLAKYVEEVYDPSIYACLGPRLLTKAVEQWQKACGTQCLTVLKPNSFYPVRWEAAKSIFQLPISEERMNGLLRDSYVLHAFNFAAKTQRASPGSIFHRVYRKNCVICSVQVSKADLKSM